LTLPFYYFDFDITFYLKKTKKHSENFSILALLLLNKTLEKSSY